MTYKQALKEAHRVGVGNAQGLPLLAVTVSTLSLRHAIVAEAVYRGAVKKGLGAAEVRKLGPIELGALMWEGE